MVFSAAWDMTITPVDTCGIVVLEGEDYRVDWLCNGPLIRALMENYRAWLKATQVRRLRLIEQTQDLGMTCIAWGNLEKYAILKPLQDFKADDIFVEFLHCLQVFYPKDDFTKRFKRNQLPSLRYL